MRTSLKAFVRRWLLVIAAGSMAAPAAAQSGLTYWPPTPGTSVSPLASPFFTGQWTVNGSLCAAGQVVQGGSPTVCTASPLVTNADGNGSFRLRSATATQSIYGFSIGVPNNVVGRWTITDPTTNLGTYLIAISAAGGTPALEFDGIRGVNGSVASPITSFNAFYGQGAGSVVSASGQLWGWSNFLDESKGVLWCYTDQVDCTTGVGGGTYKYIWDFSRATTGIFKAANLSATQSVSITADGALPLLLQDSGGQGWYSDFSNTINFNRGENSDASIGYFNYHGYLGGTTKFRDIWIMDGKTAAIAAFKGSTRTISFYGPVTNGLQSSAAWISTVAPTIASGGCTSPAVTHNNGTGAFLITIGTSCSGVKTVTLTMPAAAHLWACTGNNNTSDAAQQTNVIVARATSTTAVVLTSYDRVLGTQEDFTASDTYLMHCTGE